eukprot:365737-Chlamydomonas_euryale.AAC.7
MAALVTSARPCARTHPEEQGEEGGDGKQAGVVGVYVVKVCVGPSLRPAAALAKAVVWMASGTLPSHLRCSTVFAVLLAGSRTCMVRVHQFHQPPYIQADADLGGLVLHAVH